MELHQYEVFRRQTVNKAIFGTSRHLLAESEQDAIAQVAADYIDDENTSYECNPLGEEC